MKNNYFAWGVVIILILGIILFNSIPVISNPNDISLVLSFVGILATFIVVGNYLQVKDVEKKFDESIKIVEKKLDESIKKSEDITKKRLDEVGTNVFRYSLFFSNYQSATVTDDINKKIVLLSYAFQNIEYVIYRNKLVVEQCVEYTKIILNNHKEEIDKKNIKILGNDVGSVMGYIKNEKINSLYNLIQSLLPPSP